MTADLFSHHGDQLRQRQAPLADRMWPRNLEEFVGRERSWRKVVS